MAKRNPGASFAYQLGHAVGGAIPQVLFNAVLALVVGLVVYALRRFRASGVQVLEAIFSWPVVVVTAAFALLQYI
jgi:hypothetical protein